MIQITNIFSKVTHSQSGKDLEIGLLDEGTLIESYELNGPKLILVFRDPEHRIKNELKIQEYDELSVSYGDTWRDGGVSEKETFVVLVCSAVNGDKVKIQAMAKPVYDLKQIADKTRLFAQRGIIDIVKAVLLGGIKKLDFGKFPVVENYHIIAGERPSQTLRQMAAEQGSHIWYCRGGMHMKKFSDMFSAAPAATFHWGRVQDVNTIIKYNKPSEQVGAQEDNIRTFTGWDEKLGRIKTSPQNPLLSKAKSKPTTITGSASPFILGNAPVATKTAIDMITMGTMTVEPGQALKLMWHTPNPACPINEGLPPKVVVDTVAHWFSSQKYYCRIKGAVALEPI